MMTPHDHDNMNPPDPHDAQQHDEQLAGSFFNEEPSPVPLDDPAVRDRVNRWRQALNVLDELEDMPVAATIEPRPAQRMTLTPDDPRHAWRWTSSPWFSTGLAASILLLIGLLLVGTEIRTSNGALIVRFGPIGRSAPTSLTPDQTNSHWITNEQVDQLVQRRTDDRLAAFATDLAEAFSTMEQRRREDDAALVNAILQLRQSDLQQINGAMTDLAVESAQQTRLTRDSISRLIEAGLLRIPIAGNGDISTQDNIY